MLMAKLFLSQLSYVPQNFFCFRKPNTKLIMINTLNMYGVSQIMVFSGKTAIIM